MKIVYDLPMTYTYIITKKTCIIQAFFIIYTERVEVLNSLFWRPPTFPIKISIIGACGLDFRVRNVIGYDPTAKSPEQRI